MTHGNSVDLEHLEALAENLVESHDRLMRDLIGMRKKHHLSQEIVASRMGVSQPTVAAFERYDANPTLATIRRYALAVDAAIAHNVVDFCVQDRPDLFTGIFSGLSASWRPAESVEQALPVPEWSWESHSVALKPKANA